MTVLDASAVLAYLFDEPGAEAIEGALAEAASMGTINLAEVLTKLVDAGVDAGDAWAMVGGLPIDRVEADAELAVEIARLRTLTKAAGLSLGDRACLALGRQRGEAVLTADRAWANLDVGVDVRVIR